MAVGITVDFSSNPWVVTYNGSVTPGPTQFTLPAQIWPLAGYAGATSPFLCKRLVAIGNATAQGAEITLEDNVPSPNGPNVFADFLATGADYEPPQEWKRNKDEGGPFGCTVSVFASGWTLYIHF
jgi:hypothetical protein